MTPIERALGIDIGGTKIAVAAVDSRGRVAASEVFATEAERGFERAVERISKAATDVCSQAGWSTTELRGIGVGCTGPVSAARGIINNPYTLPTWIDCDIVSALERKFDRPVRLENDADAAALGECFAGAAQGVGRVVMLTLGTGVGGSAILDAEIYRGAGGEHPELGHILVDRAGPACYCGARGCLEAVASGSAIAESGRAAGYADAHEVFLRAAAGEVAAVEIIERACLAVASAAWTILHTFMPELIVLGGGIIDEHYDRFAPRIERQIAAATMVPAGLTRVAKARLSNRAGMVGAASLAFSRVS